MPNYQNKTKNELIKELKNLQQDYDSVKTSYEKDITGCKLAEERQAFILRSIPLLIYYSETTDNYAATRISENVKNVTGFDRDVFLKETFFWSSRLHPDDRDRVLKTFNTLQESEQGAIEYRWLCANDEYHWFLDSFSSFKKTQEGKIEFVGIWLDITERKQVAELLKESMKRLNEAQKLAHIGVWDWKPDTDTVTWTDELYRIAGLDLMLPAPTYKEHSNLYTPESWEVLKTSVEKAMEKGESYQLELELIRPNGDTRYVNAFGGPKYDSKGKAIGLFGTVQDITERKLAEEMMKTSEEKYRMIFNEVPIGIAISTIKGNIIEVNKAQAEMIGYTVEELTGKSVNEYYAYPDKRMEMIELFEKTGKVRDFEMELEKKDGSIIVVLMNIDQIKIESKDYLFVTGRDITERKLAEETLRLEKENFRHSLDDSPLGVRIATIEGNTIYANKTLLDIYGYDSLDELQKTPLKNRYTPESYIQAQKRKRQRKRGDLSATDYEISIVRKNREIRHLQVYRKEVLWDGVRQFQVICNDITERKRAEEALQREKEFAESIIETAQTIILVLDPQGSIVRFNPYLEEISGYQLAEVRGKDWFSTFLPEHVEKETSILFLKAISDIKTIGNVSPIVTKDGSELEIEWYDKTLRDLQGNIVGLLSIGQNITKRKQAEADFRKSNKLLEDLHKHLNEILENERALMSREIHDQIGQSLTALKLDLNWMHKNKSTNPEVFAKLKGMIDLVSNTIKDVQRISSDLRPGILDDLGLAAAIEWYSEEFEKRTGIKCSLSLDDSILGDPQKDLVFFRVLQEALTNVIRHAKASSVSIKLCKSGSGTAMTVLDNGIGIIPEKAESGKSLGLIGMRERVRQFGGKIDIVSKKGQGTKLTIFIPS